MSNYGSSDEKKGALFNINSRNSTSSTSSLSLKAPRTARFAEATTVDSPVGPPSATKGRNPFSGAPIITTTHLSPVPQPSDVGFGYMAAEKMQETSVEMPVTPYTPMRSALRTPGTPGRFIDPRSPTFHEEMKLDIEEQKTDKQNAADLKVKMRVRVAKFFLRGVNFSCSLIVLSMISTTVSIFNATRSLPPRNNLPPWAQGSHTWPQITLLSISCVSLALCIVIFVSYWQGGHRKAQKTQVYYSMFAIGFFIFSTIMWIIAAVVLHNSKATGNGQDLWGWSCNDNRRATLFKDEINYTLICRLQNWALICCIIEVTVEVITIAIYAVVFYRFWSKRRLHKSMNVRDRARSDLYLAQLRTQSAPNTPGLPKTPRTGTFGASFNNGDDDLVSPAPATDAAEKSSYFATADADAEYARRYERSFGAPARALTPPSPLPQAPHVRVQDATPVLEQGGFEALRPQEFHVGAAPGEQTYDSVPIPGAYAARTEGGEKS